MTTLRERILKLAWVVKRAQSANVGMGDYVSPGYNTISDPGRNNPGPYGGQPANSALPDPTRQTTREDLDKYIRTNDVSLSIVSRSGAQEATPMPGSVHFGDVVNVAPSGEGVVTLF